MFNLVFHTYGPSIWANCRYDIDTTTADQIVEILALITQEHFLPEYRVTSFMIGAKNFPVKFDGEKYILA